MSVECHGIETDKFGVWRIVQIVSYDAVPVTIASENLKENTVELMIRRHQRELSLPLLSPFGSPFNHFLASLLF